LAEQRLAKEAPELLAGQPALGADGAMASAWEDGPPRQPQQLEIEPALEDREAVEIDKPVESNESLEVVEPSEAEQPLEPLRATVKSSRRECS
jgi:hypothetical protein